MLSGGYNTEVLAILTGDLWCMLTILIYVYISSLLSIDKVNHVSSHIIIGSDQLVSNPSKFL